MADDKFYKEFREVYEAINIIGKEIMGLKKKIEVIDNNINEIKQKLDSQKISEVKQKAMSQESPEENPEKKAAYDTYVRARTGDFKPGDKNVDVNNIFYSGSKRKA